MDQGAREKYVYLAKLAEQAERYDGKLCSGFTAYALLRQCGPRSAFDNGAVPNDLIARR